MDPTILAGWERIVASPVAVALLLLAGYGIMGRVIAVQHAEIRDLNRLIREHLAATSDFDSTVRHVRKIIDLSRSDQQQPRRRRRSASVVVPAGEGTAVPAGDREVAAPDRAGVDGGAD